MTGFTLGPLRPEKGKHGKSREEDLISVNDYAVGDHFKVNLHTGRIVDATIKAIIDRTDGQRLQVDFGKDETALIYLWQVIEKVR